ncbi:glycoside hydrolase family 127 protein [uncultured Schumannella sp.]|uniref:glycoside hydrolase family 127 protein n=1 Tax=uncultured Schumannella sp. TaxID=1195956 RepID=UPI0025FDE58C|nr:beta-L-arabinofuranosidase domain-containing protein [uncultured Schumannella sp.]
MLTDTSVSPHAVMTSLPAGAATIAGDSALALLRARGLATTIPTMGDILFDAERGHAYENFRVASGDREGTHVGAGFVDGDFYKWLEAASVAASLDPDSPLAESLRVAAEAIAEAQEADGYLQTKTRIAQSEGIDRARFERPMDFETYNTGHLMTLAAIHYRVHGDDSFLRIARRVADYLIRVADENPEWLSHCNICPAHYMGAVELYRTTREEKYLRLAGRLLDLHGGKGADGTDDNQDVIPVREQRQAVGHAVRANYLYAGMADYALETGDPEIRTALDSIWNDLVGSKLAVTGGVGALYDGASPDAGLNYWTITRTHQAYGRPYQLPMVTAYNESCASLGFVFWAWRMLALTGDSRYADEIERVLFNALPAMIGTDAETYFYTNPLRQVRDLPFPMRRPGDPAGSQPPPSHERHRQAFMKGSFCCPPNIARVLAELPYYGYSEDGRDVWVHQFVPGSARVRIGGVAATLEQATSYPAEGTVTIRVRSDAPARGALRVRIPGWAGRARVTVAGEEVSRVESGYAVIEREWSDDVVSIEFDIAPRLLAAHPLVEEATGQVCVVRGPVVYALESADLPAHVSVTSVALPHDVEWTLEGGEGEFAGHTMLRGTAAQLPVPAPTPDVSLYAEFDATEPSPLEVRLVPYAMWGNRGPGEMTVWMPVLR